MRLVWNSTQNLKKTSYIAAFWSGVIAAAIITSALWASRALGLTDLNLSLMLGSMATMSVGLVPWIMGILLHLAAGGIFALCYAYIFLKVGKTGIGTGALIGLAHWLVAGIALGLAPGLHPLVPSQIPAPGFFAVAHGWFAFSALIGLHVLFGAIVGGVHDKAMTEAVTYRIQRIKRQSAA